MLLIEKMGHLTRLLWDEWKILKAHIMAKCLLIIVAHQSMAYAVFSSGE